VEQLVACVGNHGYHLEEATYSSSRMTVHYAVKDMSRALRLLYLQQSRWQRVQELEETIYEELCASCGADDQRTLDRLANLLHACRESGNLEEAIAVGLKLVALQRAACAGTERDNRISLRKLGHAVMLLGTVYRQNWQLDAAEEHLREAVERYRQDMNGSLFNSARGRVMALLAECQSANGKHDVARRTQRSALALVRVSDKEDEHRITGKRGRSSIDLDECEVMLGLAEILWRHVDSLEQSEEAADRQTSAERAAEACSLVRRVVAADVGYDRAPVVRKMLKRMGEMVEEEGEEECWDSEGEEYAEGEEDEIDGEEMEDKERHHDGN